MGVLDGMMNSRSTISFPVARDKFGRVTFISEAKKNNCYSCFGCSEPMIAKQGNQIQWHFAHKSTSGYCTDGDNALHETAKAIVSQGFFHALERKKQFVVGLYCSSCNKPTSANVALPGAMIELEKMIVDGTRSDLVLHRAQKGPVIIEIVVTHDLDPETLGLYRQSKIPVIKVKPTWNSLGKLWKGVVVPSFDTLNVPLDPCRECQAKDRQNAKRKKLRTDAEHRKELAARMRVNDLLRRMDRRRPVGNHRMPFRLWTRDSSERMMTSYICEQIYANALILIELGFRQTDQCPSLFVYRIEEDFRLVADLGLTENKNGVGDTAAQIHWTRDFESVELEYALAEGIVERCTNAGVDVFLEFFGGKFGDVNPLDHVDRSVIFQWVAEAKSQRDG